MISSNHQTVRRLESSFSDYNRAKVPALADCIDKLLFRDFELNQRLWGWSFIDNSHTLNIRRPEIGAYSDVAIVIQGGIDSYQLVEFALERYACLYPQTHIIVSTWSDSSIDALNVVRNIVSHHDHIHLILNDKPSFKGYGHMNTNLQIVSTMQGIKLACRLGVSYILKVRSDVVLGSCEFLQTLLVHHQTFTKAVPSSQRGKIIALSMNSYLCRPFSLSDHLFFGRSEDMLLMWNLKLPISNSCVREVSVIPPTGKETEPMSSNDIEHLAWSSKPQMMDESYLVSRVMNAAGYSYTFDWRDSKKFIASCFIVLDTASLDVFWPKYGGSLSYSKFRHSSIPNFANSKYGMTEISFTTWLHWYNNYL